jgi:hypothetical protein
MSGSGGPPAGGGRNEAAGGRADEPAERTAGGSGKAATTAAADLRGHGELPDRRPPEAKEPCQRSVPVCGPQRSDEGAE